MEFDCLGEWNPENDLSYLYDISTTSAEVIFRVK